MKNLRTSMENVQDGLILHESNLMEEMVELRKLRTAFMEEKCRIKNEPVICPKPRRQNMRQSGEYADQNVAAELSNILLCNKASPPFYSGSPPIRVSNPIIRDDRFREQRGQQNPTLGALM